MTATSIHCDIAIIGGGPGGSTLASLLRKYAPQLEVLVIERESFPRDHVGESQLPPISRILDQMGVWDKVEAAGFPIKFGASYTWGKTTTPWVFGFIPEHEVGDTTRPGRYQGWRQQVAFQVDRAIYDKILLDHAAELGARLLQPAKVARVALAEEHPKSTESGPEPDGQQGSAGTQRVSHLELADGRQVAARYYVDASGNAAVLRRQLGIPVDAPTVLRNVAFWNYWSRPGLNLPLLEKSTVRVLIRSISFGWLWYIALSDDRTSVGLVCHADYFKSSEKRPAELYAQAIAEEPQIAKLLDGAETQNPVATTTDWSFVTTASCGPNWFLVGEALGFADPILAAGLTLTHTSAEHCACTILELLRGNHEPDWLRQQYHQIQTRRVRQHMKFAEYWYSANGLFTSILDHCAEIASHAGLNFDPQDAFRWLSNGGIDDHPGQFAIGGLGLSGLKAVQHRFANVDSQQVAYLIDGMNTFTLDLEGAQQESMAVCREGKILAVPLLVRGGQKLPIVGTYGLIFQALRSARFIDQILPAVQQQILQSCPDPITRKVTMDNALLCLEAMVAQGWVRCEQTPQRPTLSMETPAEGKIVYSEPQRANP